MAGGEQRGELFASLPAAPSSVAAARHFTVDALRQLGARPGGIAELLVSELATNVVIHAKTPMRVRVLDAAPRYRVEVRDDDPRLPPGVGSGRLTDRLTALGGRGMMMVATLAECWGVNRNHLGKTIWFEVAGTA